MNIGTIGKHEGVCDVRGTAFFCRIFFLPKYGSAQKENFMEFRFLASSGSFPRQVECLRSLSTSGIGCHWSNKKQAACKLGLFLEEEAFAPARKHAMEAQKLRAGEDCRLLLDDA